MRLRKRTTANPVLKNNYIVSALSKNGVILAVILKVNSTDHTGEFDPFFMQRLKTAYDCMFSDEIGVSLSEDLRKVTTENQKRIGKFN